MATTFFPVYQHARPAARRFIALRGMPFFVAPSNTRYRRHFYLKFRPTPPPPLNSRRNKETYSAYTKLLRDRRFIRVFVSFSPLRNSSIIAAKTTNFRLSSTRDFFKFFKKIRIPWLKISIELRLFNILSGVIRFNMYICRSLLLVKRNEVEYHHLPGSRQADSSRRLLALIVSRHAARARYPSSSSQPLPLCCCRLTFLRHAASPRGSAPPHWQMGQQTSDYA